MCTAVAVLALLLATVRLPSDPQANWRNSFTGRCWFASATASETAGTGTWQTTFQVAEYRGTSRQPPWGIHLRYGTGSQGNFGDAFATATGGTDTFWSADFTYVFRTAGVDVRGFIGYGSFQWQTTFPVAPPPAPPPMRRATSAGVRLGADTAVQLFEAADGGKLFLDLGAVTQPWNTLTLVSDSTSTSSPDSSFEWTIALRYKWPAPKLAAKAQDYSLVSLTTAVLDGDPWASFEVRYTSRGSPYRWTGLSLALTKTY